METVMKAGQSFDKGKMVRKHGNHLPIEKDSRYIHTKILKTNDYKTENNISKLEIRLLQTRKKSVTLDCRYNFH